MICVPGAAQHGAKRSGALQTRDPGSLPYQKQPGCRISGAPRRVRWQGLSERQAARCTASGTRGRNVPGLVSHRPVLRFAAAFLAGLVTLPPAAGENFFAGKTITIICGYPPGGGVDAGARLIAQHLPKFIPGTPAVIVQSMPGAGGLVAANHLYAKAERTGLVVGVPGRDW